MRFILRADASILIGTGHVMRLLAIAEELIERGQEVIFIGNITGVEWLRTRVENFGFSETYQLEESFQPKNESDILVFDSYTLLPGNDFIKKEKWFYVVLVMDENTPRFESDLIIFPSITNKWKPYGNTRALVGPKYIPLRKSINKKSRDFNEKRPLEILIVGGGTDTSNFVHYIFSLLKTLRNEFNASLFSDKIYEKNIDSRFTVFSPGSGLDEIASYSDLVFTTASTISLEFIAREKAIGIGCAVDNQKINYEVLSSLNVIAPLGYYHYPRWNITDKPIIELVNNNVYRDFLKSKCSNLIDLHGSKRIVDEILRFK